MEEKEKKGLVKKLFSNSIIFIISILFIKLFTTAFGAANSIAGVAVLTGCFMFLKEDLGLKKKETCIAFLILFFLMAFAPKLSLINAYMGAVVNLVSIFAILVLCTYDYHAGNQVPFMLGYIFCQGNDVTGQDYMLRVAGFLVGAVLISVLYLAAHKKLESGIGFRELLKGISFQNERTVWQLKLAAGLTAIMFLGQILQVPKTMWMSFVVLSLIQPDEEEGRRRTKMRMPGVLGGTLLFVLIIGVLVPEQYHTIATLVCGYIGGFLKEYMPKTVFNAFMASLSALVLFSVKQAALLRIITNLAGVIFTLIYASLFNSILQKINGMRKNNLEIAVEE